jgi:hypothetical protein
MRGSYGQALRFADTPHDEFEWQDMIAGESRFAVVEPHKHNKINEQAYEVLRLVNTPKGVVVAPDERGLHIARPRDGDDVVMFKMVDNPNYQQSVTHGGSLVDDNERTLMRQVVTDERHFIPLPLTPEETMAAVAELELAAQAYQRAASAVEQAESATPQTE